MNVAIDLSSKELFARAQNVFPGGTPRAATFSNPPMPYVDFGEGPWLLTVDGDRLLDCSNNFTALIHGNAHPKINAAIQKQLAKGTAFSLPTQAEIELGEVICDRVDHFEAIRFSNSGTEAVLWAVKAARAITGRPKIAKCEGAYHGGYDFAEVSSSSRPENWGRADAPLSVATSYGTPQGVLENVVVLPFNDVAHSLALLEAHAGDLAGVMIDPMASRAGLIAATPEYLQMIRDFCNRSHVVMIYDEVLTFRLAKGGDSEAFGVRSDISALGKIIGGGMPVGAIAGKKDFMSIFDNGAAKPKLYHSGTYSANPVTMVAGKAALELLDDAAFAHLNRLGERVREGLRHVCRQRGIEHHVTGMSSLFRLHFGSAPPTDYRSSWEMIREASVLGDGFTQAMMQNGVHLLPIGTGALSTVMTDEDVDFLLDAAGRSIDMLT
jgi:glutamate-1-semialdehyde 2,1-aminomutase